MPQDSKYRGWDTNKRVDVKSVVRKSFIRRAQYEFDGSGAILSGELILENVMGQEDINRLDAPGGIRIDNSLSGRIIWSSGIRATSKVYYSAENETFNLESSLEDTPVDPNGEVYHEVFLFDLDIDTEYAFQVESYDADGNYLRSDTYWFQIGGELLVSSQFFSGVDLLITVISKSLSIDLVNEITTIVGTGLNLGISTIDAAVFVSTSVALGDSEEFTNDENQFDTEIITVVI